MRHKDERIRIGENVILTVVEIRGDKVRLGFEAPRDLPIDREEIFQEKKRKEKKNDENDSK